MRIRLRIGATALVSGLLLLLQAQTLTLHIAHTPAPVEPYQIGFEKFHTDLEKATGGAIEVKIFRNGQLGDESIVLKSLQNGSIGMAVVASVTLADYALRIHIFDLPLFTDLPQAYAGADAKIGKQADERLNAKGLVRNLHNNWCPDSEVHHIHDVLHLGTLSFVFSGLLPFAAECGQLQEQDTR